MSEQQFSNNSQQQATDLNVQFSRLSPQQQALLQSLLTSMQTNQQQQEQAQQPTVPLTEQNQQQLTQPPQEPTVPQQQQRPQQQQQPVQQHTRQRQGFVSILEEDFSFEISDTLLDGIFEKKNKRKLFNEAKKRALVQQCAEQLYLNREEFYYRRQNAVMKNALSRILPDASDNHISILITAIGDFRRNHWIKKGKPYHSMWKEEMKYKNLDYRKGVRFQCSSEKKSQTQAKSKSIVLPEVMKDQAQLDGIKKDLKKAYENDSANTDTIARLLEASYYDRISRLRSCTDAFSFKDYLRQYPVLVNMDWLYYEWRLAKAYLKEDCSLEYTDFEKKMWDLTRFMALYMVASGEDKLLLERMHTFLQRKARSNLSTREETVDADSVERELQSMHKASALKSLITSQAEWKEYHDQLLLAFIQYIDRKWRTRSSTQILIECTTLSTDMQHAHIAAMNSRPDGTYRHYAAVIDHTVVMRSEDLMKTFIMYYCACDIGARKLGSELLRTFLDETVVGETRGRASYYINFIQKLKDCGYEREPDMQDFFPDFTQFADRTSSTRSLPVFDTNRLLIAGTKKKKTIQKAAKKPSAAQKDTSKRGSKRKQFDLTDESEEEPQRKPSRSGRQQKKKTRVVRNESDDDLDYEIRSDKALQDKIRKTKQMRSSDPSDDELMEYTPEVAGDEETTFYGIRYDDEHSDDDVLSRNQDTKNKTTQRAVQKDTIRTAGKRKQTDLSDDESIQEPQKRRSRSVSKQKVLYHSEADDVDDSISSRHVVKKTAKQIRSYQSGANQDYDEYSDDDLQRQEQDDDTANPLTNPEEGSRVAWRWDQLENIVVRRPQKATSSALLEEPQKTRSRRKINPTACSDCGTKLVKSVSRHCSSCKKHFCEVCADACAGVSCESDICVGCAVTKVRRSKTLLYCKSCCK